MLERLVFFSATRPARPLQSAALMAIVAIVVLLGARDLMMPEVLVANDGHALASLDMAVTRAFCGTPSAFALDYRAPMYVRDHPGTKDQSLRQMMIDQAGSLSAYCAAINQPFVNNENSLMVLEIWLLRLNPSMSYAGIGRSLHSLRVAGLLFVGFVLLESGFSLWLCAGTFVAGLLVLHAMLEHIASVYPFLGVLVAVAAAAYAYVLGREWTRTTTGLVAAAALAGAYSAFGTNMRTSYLPVFLALFGLFVVLSEGRLVLTAAQAVPTALWRTAVMVVVFAASYGLFQYVTITRHIPPNITYNRTTHSIAHPLVLALAVPDNAFSRREGIRWEDEVGRQLALRTIPDAVYLGPRYDEALFQYYRQAWRSDPRGMLSVYWVKAKTAGKHMVTVLRGSTGGSGRFWRVLLLPLAFVPNGIWLGALFAAVTAGTITLAIRRSSAAFGLVGLMSVAALFLLLESAVIMSIYVPNYHNYLAFYAAFISLCGGQLAVNVLGQLAGIGPRPA